MLLRCCSNGTRSTGVAARRLKKFSFRVPAKAPARASLSDIRRWSRVGATGTWPLTRLADCTLPPSSRSYRPAPLWKSWEFTPVIPF
jgi:hypothetical protein